MIVECFLYITIMLTIFILESFTRRDGFLFISLSLFLFSPCTVLQILQISLLQESQFVIFIMLLLVLLATNNSKSVMKTSCMTVRGWGNIRHRIWRENARSEK